MAKRKISIPLVVTRTGAMVAGCAILSPDETTNDVSGALDCDGALESLDQADYDSGYQIVVVEAEVDVALLFKDHVVQGSVSNGRLGD